MPLTAESHVYDYFMQLCMEIHGYIISNEKGAHPRYIAALEENKTIKEKSKTALK